MNSIYYRDDLMLFRVNDYYVGHLEISPGNHYDIVSLPDEFMGSREFCRAYVITYTEKQDKQENILFFAVADSSYGWLRIYQITESGEQVFLERGSGKLSTDVEVIVKTAFS